MADSAKDIGKKAEDLKEKALEFTSEVGEDIKKKAEDVKSKVRGGWESLEEKARDVKRDIERK